MQDFRLGITFALQIGKYLKSNNDYINLMKVNKKYKCLIELFRYNPISDITLFENMQTQHFYKVEDRKLKKSNMFRYIHWYKINYDDIGVDDFAYYIKNDSGIQQIQLNDNDILKNVYVESYQDVPVNMIDLPNFVNVIGKNACKKDYKLKDVILGKGIKILKNDCFYKCYFLQNVKIPYGLTVIKSRCFYDCESLKSITLPFSLKKISSLAFYGTCIKKVDLLDENKCNHFDCLVPMFIKNLIEKNNVICPNYYLDKADIDKRIIDIHDLDNPTIDLIIPDGVQMIGRKCFDQEDITNVFFPSSLKKICRFAFERSHVKTLTFKSNVQINFNAFILCKELNHFDFKDNSTYKMKYTDDFYKKGKDYSSLDKNLYNDYYYSNFFKQN